MYKKLLLFITILVLHGSILSQDHLVPQSGIFTDIFPAYHLEIDRVLQNQLGPEHTINMICIPSFEPSWSITLTKDENSKCKLISSKAKQNIWPLWLSASKKQQHVKVKVERKEKIVDTLFTKKIFDLWDDMFKNVHYPIEDRIGLDGVGYYFNQFIVGNGWKCGQIWSPIEKTKTWYYAEIGKRLFDFVRSESNDSEKIINDINLLLKKVSE